MRRLNIKFLVCLLVAALLIAGGVHLLWAINVEKSTHVVLDKAKAALERGDLRDAVRFYSDYLNRNPDDKEQISAAAIAAADIVEATLAKPEKADQDNIQRDIKLAYQLMERALRKAPERTDIRKRQIDLLIKVGGFDEARKHLDKLDQAGELEQDSEMAFLDAVCAIRLGNDMAAFKRLESLVGYHEISKEFDRRTAVAPENTKAYALLATLLFRKDDDRGADAVLDQLVAANPQSAEAYLTRSRYLREFNKTGTKTDREARIERAKDDLRKALQLDATGADVLMENALIAMSENEYDLATGYLDRAQKEHPLDQRVYVQQARLALLQKDYAAAAGHYEKGLQLVPGSRELLWFLFETQLQTRDVKAAEATIARMKKAKFPSERIALAEAQLPLVQENWREARRRLEAVRPEVAQVAGLAEVVDVLLGRCYERLNEPDKQYEAFTRVLAVNPRSDAAVRGLISAMLGMQRYDEAFGRLRDLRQSMGEEAFQADANLMANYYRVVEILGRQNPDSRLFQREAAALRNALAKNRAADNTGTLLLEADALVRDKKLVEARRKLGDALKAQPDDVRLQRAYLQVVIQQQGPAAGLRLLDAALNATQRRWEDSAQIRLMQADLLTKADVPDAKARLAALEQGLDKFSPAEQAGIWRGLGVAYYNLAPRDYDQVRRCWEKVIELDPSNIEIRELLFDLARDQSDDVGLLGLLSDVEHLEGKDGTLWPYFRAKYLLWMVQRGQADASALSEASRLAEQVARRRPGWYAIVKLDGEINDVQGNAEQAITQYRQALKLGPADPRTVRRLTELLMAKGQNAEARDVINMLGQTPAGMERQKVVLEALGGDPQKAAAALAQAVPDDSQNAWDFLWKGRILNHLKKPDEAEKAFRRAVQLAPSVPQARLVLVEHLVRAGKPQAAEAEVRKAESQLSEDRAPLTLAQSYALLGHQALAQQYYQTALAAAPDNLAVLQSVAEYYLQIGQNALALQHLKAILRETDRTGRSLSSYAVWARRALAPVLAASGDYASFRSALAVLEANQSGGQLSPADQRIKAQLLAKRPEPGFQSEALQLLEQLDKTRGLLQFDERLLLATLYDKSDRWSDARELLLELIGEKGRDPALLATFGEMLLDHNETAQAAGWIEKLRRIAPKQLQTLRLIARLYLQQDKKDEALSTIRPLAGDRSAPEYAERLLLVARVLDDLKLYAESEATYRQLAALAPKYKLVLAVYLQRRGFVDDALATCEAVRSKETIRAICEIGTMAVESNAGKLSAAQIKQVDEWIAEGLRQFPDSTELETRKVALLMAQDRFDEAESLAASIMQGNMPDLQRGVLANNLAYQRAVRGKGDQRTMDLIEQAVHELGPRQELLDTRAMAYMVRGDCAEAIRDLETATAFGDRTGGLYFHLALAYQCADDVSRARLAMDQAQQKGFSQDALSSSERSRFDALSRWLR